MIFYFLAGFVVRMVKKITFCQRCCQALECNTPSSFISLKDRGGLIKPSADVVKICEETERKFQRMLITNKGNLPKSNFFRLFF
jgi:hypothetical protein